MDSSRTSSKMIDAGSMTQSPQNASEADQSSRPTSNDDDLTYFLKSNIECMERSMRNLRAYIEERRSELDLNRCQMMILRDHLGGRKLFSITEIANRYGVSYQTARNHVNGLLRMGLVHAHSKDGKTVLYIVSDNIRV